MTRVKKPKLSSRCKRPNCDERIPDHKRSDAKYCSESCRAAEEKARYCKRNPNYVKKQRRLVCEIRHMETYGHTDFIDNPMGNPNDRFRKARAMGYRSGLEVAVARQLEKAGVPFEYETTKIHYRVDEVRSYRPDYVLPNGIIVETKGRFVVADRKKHLLIKKQHPHLDIRFVFTNSKAKINKGSKTTYGMWCEKHGFQYADKLIPKEWLDEHTKDT
jgi:hypothetical protein